MQKGIENAAWNNYGGFDWFEKVGEEERLLPEGEDMLWKMIMTFSGRGEEIEWSFFKVDAGLSYMKEVTCQNDDHMSCLVKFFFFFANRISNFCWLYCDCSFFLKV